MTVDTLYDRVNTIVASQPFAYRQGDPFNTETTADQVLDKSFSVGMALENTEGILGFYQTERWLVSMRLRRKVRGDPVGTYRQLTLDVNSLTATLCREDATAEFTFEEDEFRSIIAEPEASDDFLEAELSGVANFERAL